MVDKYTRDSWRVQAKDGMDSALGEYTPRDEFFALLDHIDELEGVGVETENPPIFITLSVDPETAKLLFKDIGYTIADLSTEQDGLTDEQRSKLVDAYLQLRDACINEGKS